MLQNESLFFFLGYYSLPLLNSSNIPKLPIKVKRRAVGSPEEFNHVTKQLKSNASYFLCFLYFLYRNTILCFFFVSKEIEIVFKESSLKTTDCSKNKEFFLKENK